MGVSLLLLFQKDLSSVSSLGQGSLLECLWCSKKNLCEAVAWTCEACKPHMLRLEGSNHSVHVALEQAQSNFRLINCVMCVVERDA